MITNAEKRRKLKREFLKKHFGRTEITTKEMVVLAVIGAIGLGVMWLTFYLIFGLGLLFI